MDNQKQNEFLPDAKLENNPEITKILEAAQNGLAVHGEKIKNKEPLPTPLDVKNVPSKPDYYLRTYPYVDI